MHQLKEAFLDPGVDWTLVKVQPDGLQQRLHGDVIQCFERRSFKLVGMKMLQEPGSILAELHRKITYPSLIITCALAL